MKNRNIVLICSVILAGISFLALPAHAQTKTWQLSPIIGDNTANWKEKPNWTWSDGNPMSESDATWRLAIQPLANPEIASRHTNMVQGLYVNFVRIWKGDKQEAKDPENQYRNFQLLTRGNARESGPGPASVLMFRPSTEGSFALQIAAKVYVQNKTAGYARATLYTLNEDETTGEQLKMVDLNQAGGFESTGKPDTLKLDQTVTLKAGQWLALRIQGVNPGPASSGTVGLNFDPKSGGVFKITKQ